MPELGSGAGVNTSFYDTTQPQGPQNLDPFVVMERLADIRNAINKNTEFQSTYAAQQAAGRIMQKHIQADGTVDQPGYATELAGSPEAGFLFPSLIKGLSDNKGVDLSNVHTNLENHAVGNLVTGNAAAALTAAGANGQLTPELEDRIWGNVGQTGLVPQDRIDTLRAGIPKDPQAKQVYYKALAEATEGAGRTLDANVGSMQNFNLGGTQVQGSFNPRAGLTGRPTLTGVGEQTNTPTPGEMNTPTEQQDQMGGKTLVPRAAAYPQVDGKGNLVPGTGSQPGRTEQPKVSLNTLDNINSDVIEKTRALPQQDANIALIRNLLTPDPATGKSPVETGWAQDKINTLQAAAKRLGVPDEVIAKFTGTMKKGDPVAATQLLAKAMLLQSTDIAHSGIGGQHLTNDQFDTYHTLLGSNQTVTTDTLRGIENYVIHLNNMQHEMRDAGNTFMNMMRSNKVPGLDATAYPQYVQDRLFRKGLTNYNPAAPAGNTATPLEPNTGTP